MPLAEIYAGGTRRKGGPAVPTTDVVKVKVKLTFPCRAVPCCAVLCRGARCTCTVQWHLSRLQSESSAAHSTARTSHSTAQHSTGCTAGTHTVVQGHHCPHSHSFTLWLWPLGGAGCCLPCLGWYEEEKWFEISSLEPLSRFPGTLRPRAYYALDPFHDGSPTQDFRNTEKYLAATIPFCHVDVVVESHCTELSSAVCALPAEAFEVSGPRFLGDTSRSFQLWQQGRLPLIHRCGRRRRRRPRRC